MREMTKTLALELLHCKRVALKPHQMRFNEEGWDSFVIDLPLKDLPQTLKPKGAYEGRAIIKLPYDRMAAKYLIWEEKILSAISKVSPHLASLAHGPEQPRLGLHHRPRLFSIHEKLEGVPLSTHLYQAMNERQKTRLANDIAGFFAQLHKLTPKLDNHLKKTPYEAWFDMEATQKTLFPSLPSKLCDWAEKVHLARQAIKIADHQKVFGHFDLHGQNMLLHQLTKKLKGVIDFGDAAYDDFHMEFHQINLVSPDLTKRVMCRYEAITDKTIEPKHVALNTAICRLSEATHLKGETKAEFEEALLLLEDWWREMADPGSFFHLKL